MNKIACGFLRWILVLTALPLAAADLAPPAALAGLDDVLAAAIREFKAPGLAVAVVKDGKVLFARGYGYRDAGHQLPVTGATLFPIASITKSFTVTALGTLVDEGQLDWDTPVREYLPGFRMHDPVATEQLTPRDLVTHRTGLPRHDLVWYTSSLGREDLVSRLRYLEPNKPIREKFQYNNLMFITAGYLGGKVAGSTWETLVGKNIFTPLGMTNSRYTSEEARTSPDHALPYRKNRKSEEVSEIPFARFGDVGPAGAINSCIDDMSRYLLMHLSRGAFEGRQVLGRNNAEQMQSPQMVLQGSRVFPELGEACYGMGFFIDSYRGHKHVYHGGNLDGFSLQLSFLPNDGVGVVVLANLDGTRLRDLIPYLVYDRLLGLERVDWVGRFREIEAKARDQELGAGKQGYTGRKEGTHPSHDLADYAGEYEHPGYGRLALHVEGTGDARKLVLKLNDVERPLQHFHYDTFQVPENPLDSFEKLRVTLPTDAQGEISRLEATLEEQTAEIVFTRAPEKRMFDTAFLQQFTGVYETPGQPQTISLSGGHTLQIVSPGAPPKKLIPRHGTRFAVEGLSGVIFEFKLDDRGKAGEMVIYTPDAVSVVPRKP